MYITNISFPKKKKQTNTVDTNFILRNIYFTIIHDKINYIWQKKLDECVTVLLKKGFSDINIHHSKLKTCHYINILW